MERLSYLGGFPVYHYVEDLSLTGIVTDLSDSGSVCLFNPDQKPIHY